MIDGGGRRRVHTTVKALVLALLLATSALAQPVVGPEMTTPPVEFGDVAIAPLRDGYVAAWSDAGRIHVAHLDASLRVTDPTLDILTTASNAQVPALAVATNGSSVFLVWNEKRPGYAEVYGAAISADVRTLLRGPLLINNTDRAPVITVQGGKYRLLSGDQLFLVDEQLKTESTPFGSPFLAAALGETGDIATVAMTSEKKCTVGLLATCSLTETFTFQSPSFATNFTLSANFYNPSYSPLTHVPLVVPHGDHFIGVLATSTQTAVFEMSPNSLNGHWGVAPLNAGQALAIAGNGNDAVLVAWRYPTLSGVVLHSDGTTSQPFEIARGDYVDFAKVSATSSNDFVVVYRYYGDGQHSIVAGRVVHVQPPPRQRSVR